MNGVNYVDNADGLQSIKRVYIVGAGAIGKSLAVLLQLKGVQVTLIRAREGIFPSHEHIHLRLQDGRSIRENIAIESFECISPRDSLIVIASKSNGNARLARLLSSAHTGTPLVLMQNGLGVEDDFISLGFSNLYRCVLFVTGQFGQDGELVFKPVSKSAIGSINGRSDSLSTITTILDTADFSFSVDDSIEFTVWKKAIANCVFNSICPLLETDNGIFHRDELALALGRRVVDECVAIANNKGIDIFAGQVMESILAISKASDGQDISTLQDIRHGRETEIASLNLAIARMADDPDNVRCTTLLGELTLLKSMIRKRELVDIK